jgi:ornithine carbamoyltransferase
MNKNAVVSRPHAVMPRIDSAKLPRIGTGQLRRDQDISATELAQLLDLAADVKRHPQQYDAVLAGKYFALLFEKPLLRTRLTFELAVKQLGGDFVVNIAGIGDREPVKDVARNLARWCHGLVARTFLQQTVDDLAQFSERPVINALSDMYHPCQAFADFQTLAERFGDLKGLKLAYIGDGNNVAHSLMLNAARLGVEIAIAAPKGYEPDAEITKEARELGGAITITSRCPEAVEGAHAVYTDVWASMGQEAEADERKRIFAPYQVNEALMAKARPDAIFMHCLPAKRGLETTDAVMESPQSVVFDQAENRLHAQKALMVMLYA